MLQMGFDRQKRRPTHRDQGWTPSEGCSRRGYDHPRAVCRQRSGAADRRDAFLVLNLSLDVVDGMGGLDLEGSNLTRQGLDEDYRGDGGSSGGSIPSICYCRHVRHVFVDEKTETNVVVAQDLAILELLAGEDLSSSDCLSSSHRSRAIHTSGQDRPKSTQSCSSAVESYMNESLEVATA